MHSKRAADLINIAKQNDWLIGIFGWGIWGKNYGVKIIDWLGLNLDFVSDSDEEKINNLRLKGMNIIHKVDLLKKNEEILLFICIGQYYLEEVKKQLEINRNIKIITLDEVLDMDIVLERFYEITDIRSYEKRNRNLLSNISNDYMLNCKLQNRIAVYTCIIGGYDSISEPLLKEENCDYYLISDVKPDNLKIFTWIDVKKVVPENIKGFPEMNRYCKMHGGSIFKDYKYSIYMDGTIQIVGKISNYIEETGKIGIGIDRHRFEDCIYVEGMRMVGVGTCDYAEVRKQMVEYLHEGMPRNYGLFECCIIVCDHSNYWGRTIMDQWFEEYMKGAKRDQFSLTYVLWKNGLTADSIGSINNGKGRNNNPSIRVKRYHLQER